MTMTYIASKEGDSPPREPPERREIWSVRIEPRTVEQITKLRHELRCDTLGAVVERAIDELGERSSQ